MRTLDAIMEEVESGGQPEYEEIYCALLAYKALNHFNHSAIRGMREHPDGPLGAEYQYRESFNRHKRALQVPPDRYTRNHDPRSGDYQKRRDLALRLFNKISAGIDPKEASE